MKDLPENELVILAQAGDADAENELVRSFEPMARSVAAKYGRFGYEPEALQQIARVGVMHAVRVYSPTHRTKLGTFAFGLCRRYVLTELKRLRLQAANDDIELGDGFLASKALPSPESTAIHHDLARQVAESVEAENLDTTDYTIFVERILNSALSLSEVAKVVGLSKSSVRLRELRLRDEVLPRVLAPLKDAL